MPRKKIHIIHVGHMANKGTQALLISDVSVIREIVGDDVSISVSTTNIGGVRKLGLPLSPILPTTIDIPYEKADYFAEQFGLTREGVAYKLVALGELLYVFVQILLCVPSVMLIKSNLKSLYKSETLARIRDCDIIVSCSDENFKESASMLPINVFWIPTWWSMLISKTWEILIAKFLGKPVIMFPNSIGPFRTYFGKILSKIALDNCDLILVREPISYNEAKSLKIRSPLILTFDTAILANAPEKLPPHNDKKPKIGVCAGIYSHSVSRKQINQHIEAYAKALDQAVEKYACSVVFLPHYVRGFRYDDLEISNLILSKMKNKSKASVVNTATFEEFKVSISQVDMLVSSKMHPSVLAAAAFVPSICIAYDHKQTGFFMTLGLDDCVIPLGRFSSEILSKKIDYVWSRKESIRNLLLLKVPELQKNVKESIMQAIGLFVDKPIK